MTIKQNLRSVARLGLAYLRETLGAESRYGIRAGYTHRSKTSHFDDTGFTDEYQKEVYLRAAELASREGWKTVADVGCGSGYKLVKYCGQFETVGIDVPETVEFLRRTYPDRRWETADLSRQAHFAAELVICSDVIEHVQDPDQLMAFLQSATRKLIVISTPDRRRQYTWLSPYQLGPPQTEHHVREWTFDEFRQYVSRFFDVMEHSHPNAQHATQMVVASVRQQSGSSLIQD